MKVRKNLLVISIAVTLMAAVFYVPQAGAAIQTIIVRPYHFYGPAWYPGLMRIGDPRTLSFHRLVTSR